MELKSKIEILAQEIGCDWQLIWAIFYHESRFKQKAHRFEPHIFSKVNRNFTIPVTEYATAYKINAEDANFASSWGIPQIMGFHHVHFKNVGVDSANAFAQWMLDSINSQFYAFKTFVLEIEPQAGSCLRSHDLECFAEIYNGPAHEKNNYVNKIQNAANQLNFRIVKVLKKGSTGPVVSYLQDLLTIPADGFFGPETEQAVRRYQENNGLIVDGIVGKKTWTSLEAIEEKIKIPDLNKIEEIWTNIGPKVTAVVGASTYSIYELTMMFGPYVLLAAGLGLLSYYFYKRYKNGRTRNRIDNFKFETDRLGVDQPVFARNERETSNTQDLHSGRSERDNVHVRGQFTVDNSIPPRRFLRGTELDEF